MKICYQDEWMDERTDGWTNKRTDGWMLLHSWKKLKLNGHQTINPVFRTSLTSGTSLSLNTITTTERPLTLRAAGGPSRRRSVPDPTADWLSACWTIGCWSS